MQAFGISVTFKFGECKPGALDGIQLMTMTTDGLRTSYEPNLMADSGITFMTLIPFPGKSAISRDDSG